MMSRRPEEWPELMPLCGSIYLPEEYPVSIPCPTPSVQLLRSSRSVKAPIPCCIIRTCRPSLSPRTPT